MTDRALVRNAADPQQVTRAARKVKDRHARFALALKAVLGTVDGRLVVAELLERAGLYQSVYDHSGSAMYFKEGRRNFGLELQAACVDADEDAFDLGERERRARRRHEDRETDAAHTPRADAQGEQA